MLVVLLAVRRAKVWKSANIIIIVANTRKDQNSGKSCGIISGMEMM